MSCNQPRQPWRLCWLLRAFLLLPLATLRAEQPSSPEALLKKLRPFTQPPAEFAEKFGPYKSPLKFADGSLAKSPVDWTRRRAEILKTWHQRLGPWPPL